jgi:hypothetical protein
MLFCFVCVKVAIAHSTDDHRYYLAPLCFQLITPDLVLILKIVFNYCSDFFVLTQAIQADPSALKIYA